MNNKKIKKKLLEILLENLNNPYLEECQIDMASRFNFCKGRNFYNWSSTDLIIPSFKYSERKYLPEFNLDYSDKKKVKFASKYVMETCKSRMDELAKEEWESKPCQFCTKEDIDNGKFHVSTSHDYMEIEKNLEAHNFAKKFLQTIINMEEKGKKLTYGLFETQEYNRLGSVLLIMNQMNKTGIPNKNYIGKMFNMIYHN